MSETTLARPEDYYAAGDDVVSAMNALFDGDGLRLRHESVPELLGVASYYTVRTLRNYAAVLQLCKQDFGVEAQAIVRLMLEGVIDLRYISTDPDVLAVQWVEHEQRRRYYYFKAAQRLGDDLTPPNDWAEVEALIARDWEDARELAGRGATRAKVKRHLLTKSWTRKNLYQRAEAAEAKWKGTKDGYHLYEYLCEHTHGSASGAGDYMVAVNGTVHLAVGQTGYKGIMPLALATCYAHWAFQALHDLCVSEDLDVITVARERVDMEAALGDMERHVHAEAEVER